jgi:polyisoprenyl-phosphate glycosyltransferase
VSFDKHILHSPTEKNLTEAVNQTPVLSVVIPLFKEAPHLEDSISEIVKHIRSTEYSFELMLIDDGSPDNTWQIIVDQKKNFEQIRGIRLSRNFGKESALAAGLEAAVGKVVLVMDGDLQHPPSLIPDMLDQWTKGAEVVEAVKSSRGQESIASRWRAGLFYRIFKSLTGVDLRGASDFKLMDRRVIDSWLLMKERNLFFRGMNAWLGFRRVQIPFNVADRAGGQTGWSVLHLLKLAISAVTSFSSAPLYLMVIGAVGFAGLAVILGIQTLFLKFNGHAIDGFTTVIILILILGSALMFGLGLIGIYIARIYDEVKARPRFLIAEHID